MKSIGPPTHFRVGGLVFSKKGTRDLKHGGKIAIKLPIVGWGEREIASDVHYDSALIPVFARKSEFSVSPGQ